MRHTVNRPNKYLRRPATRHHRSSVNRTTSRQPHHRGSMTDLPTGNPVSTKPFAGTHDDQTRTHKQTTQRDDPSTLSDHDAALGVAVLLADSRQRSHCKSGPTLFRINRFVDREYSHSFSISDS